MGDVAHWCIDPIEYECMQCGWKGNDPSGDACPLCFETDLVSREPDDDSDRAYHDDRGDN